MYHEAEEADEMLRKSFALLKEDIKTGVSEKAMIEDLSDAEKAIGKEIHDITKASGAIKKKKNKEEEEVEDK